ncbi:MAG: argininosuccinate lyase [Beijerinckiaceae bacterium]|nr:argininosuccinate lyase [Beijerinckiaceae bacterium]MCZ8300359.1 argininosuccinate lyase [Beijerinckiaceae bacterium]
MTNQPARLWGGRFRKAPDPSLMRLSSAGIAHQRLIPQDIAGSLAHAAELERAGLLTLEEQRVISQTLEAMRNEYLAGLLVIGPGDEDIHTFLERVLVERLGATGAKLRAGRSRNDQAANNLKLYLRQETPRLVLLMGELAEALAIQAGLHAAAVAPGFTHLQSAQPVTFGHWLMAHAQPLLRNISRLQDFLARTGECPLGAAALAGSAIALSPALSARQLGYAGPAENSVDAVSARDHVAEFLFVAAMTLTDLSRLAEEITLWVSRQFGWIELDDAFATGSSIMPQKKNPDIAELSRGRAARLIGDLVAMLGAIKGLPLAYNRDLAEDKRAAFDAIDVLDEVLPALTGLVRTMTVRTERLRAQAGEGFSLATEVADYLARKGVPFAEAHEITGTLVRHCESIGLALEALSPAELASVDPRLGADLQAHLSLDAAIAARSGHGGTAPERVREQIATARARLAAARAWAEGKEGEVT